MTITDKQIEQIANILTKWNPLGDKANKITDLNGYQTEAEDIAFDLEISGAQKNIARVICVILNQAFNLSLSIDDCLDAASEIKTVLNKGSTN